MRRVRTAAAVALLLSTFAYAGPAAAAFVSAPAVAAAPPTTQHVIICPRSTKADPTCDQPVIVTGTWDWDVDPASAAYHAPGGNLPLGPVAPSPAFKQLAGAR